MGLRPRRVCWAFAPLARGHSALTTSPAGKCLVGKSGKKWPVVTTPAGGRFVKRWGRGVSGPAGGEGKEGG